MSAIANSLQKPERFDLYVRKFRALCMMHGVEVGAGGDLHGFMQKLMDDRHLSMKFWRFVGDLSDREGGEFSDDQILAIVVEGVTGGESSEEDAGLKQDVDNLRAMLSGVDIQGPEYSQVELAPFPRSEPSPQEDERESTPHLVDLPPKRSEARAAYISAAVEREMQQAAQSPTMLPPQLDEGVLRYEISNLVKQYLEDLDKRISQSESRRRGVHMGTVANATTPRSLEEQPDKPPKEEMEDPPIMPIGKPRLVLATPDDDDIPMNIPLENYSPPRGFGTLVLGVVLALTIFEGADAAYENRVALGRDIVALMDGHFSLETKQAASGYRFAPPPPPPPSVEQGGLPAFQGTLSLPSTSPDAAPQPTTSIVPQIAEEVPGPNNNSNRNVAASRVTPPVEQTPPDGISSTEEASAVKVAPSTMEANLVMSRVPVYPEIAKMDRVEGNVVMEAIISKDGMVTHVHVIQGDSRLRNAATEAVYKRRYRPYIRDGQPVEVATTIAVDFRLHR
jgi:TonB family protein